ncbi:MAG TPA: VWA domain-containing protein, partial [Thermoanaerobaculia bacterium]|nr:VWA domain-containing protein [Thermoanaerobaculia bacterium]
MRAPDRVSAGEPFRVTVTLRATKKTEATLRLLRDGTPISAGRVTLPAGTPGVYQLEERAADAAGAVVYEARLEADEDGVPENNRASAIVRVEGTPRVLVVDRKPASATPLVDALRRAGIRAEAAAPGGLPSDLVGLASYDAVLLSDVPSTNFSDAQLEALRTYVEVVGGGLGMLGGPESFGPGGWARTPVEAVLPLDMDVKNPSVFPSLGLVLLIDKSGSMAGMGETAKVEVAKAAGAEVISLLSPIDWVGVVAFDDAAKWVVPMSPGSEKANAVSLLGTLRAGGGTDAYPAMEEARKALSATKTRVKHVILLTDGQLAGRDHEGLARAMAAEGVTLSTVGIGTDADLFTLEKIAEAGKGRFYRAEDVSLVPRIFLREA